MLFYLLVSELKHLHSIREGRLCCLGLSKVVHHLLIWISLLYVIVVKVDYGVAVWEDFPLYPVVKDYFFLPIFIQTLDLSIISNDLLYNLHVLWTLIMILLRKLHFIVFVLILNSSLHISVVNNILLRGLLEHVLVVFGRIMLYESRIVVSIHILKVIVL